MKNLPSLCHTLLVLGATLLFSSCITDSSSQQNTTVVLSETAAISSPQSSSSSQTDTVAYFQAQSSVAQTPSSSSVSITPIIEQSSSATSSSVISSSAQMSSLGQSSSSASVMDNPKVQVHMYRYTFNTIDCFSIWIVNNDVIAHSNLVLWMNLTDVAGLENILGLRSDIMIQYDAAGFAKAASPETINAVTLTARNTRPEALAVINGLTHYRFGLDFSSLVIPAAGKFRIDIAMDKRSPWPPYLDLMNQNPGITFGADDYSFAAIPVEEKNYGDVTLPPTNPNVLLEENGTLLWGYPEIF